LSVSQTSSRLVAQYFARKCTYMSEFIFSVPAFQPFPSIHNKHFFLQSLYGAVFGLLYPSRSVLSGSTRCVCVRERECARARARVCLF
jgi:hypothetical protein